MPISSEEFESGELNLSLLITQFFRANPDYAYSVEELMQLLEPSGTILTDEDMQNILRSLEREERIKSKIIQGVVYYAYYKPKLGFRVGGSYANH